MRGDEPAVDRAAAVAGKELKLFFRDAQMLFFSLALPLVLILLMVATFGGQTRFNTTAYVVNLDEGPDGAEFVARLEAVPGITVKLLDEATARRRVQDAELVNVLILGRDFTAELESGGTPVVRVLQRGLGGTEGQIVNSYAVGLARALADERLVARQGARALEAAGRPVDRAAVDAKVAELFAEAEADPPVAVREEPVGGRSEPVAIYLPGLVTMFTLFTISLTSVSLVGERKKGTLERLATTRLTRVELLAGNWLAALGRGLVQVVFLFGLAWAAFRVFTPGSFACVLVFGTVTVASVAAIGLVIAALSRTPEQANWVAVFFTMVMTTLGGSFFDTAGARGMLGVLTRLTYNFWANDGFRRIILRSETLSSPALVRDMAVLGAVGVAGWVLALAFFRLRGDSR